MTRNDDLCSLFSPVHVFRNCNLKLLRNSGLVQAGCNILPLARKVVLERFINSALMYLGKLHRIVMEREALNKRCCRRKFVFFSHSPVCLFSASVPFFQEGSIVFLYLELLLEILTPIIH